MKTKGTGMKLLKDAVCLDLHTVQTEEETETDQILPGTHPI
jgi:hypothetical protein